MERKSYCVTGSLLVATVLFNRLIGVGKLTLFLVMNSAFRPEGGLRIF